MHHLQPVFEKFITEVTRAANLEISKRIIDLKLENQRLQDRVEELENVIGLNVDLISDIRRALGATLTQAKIAALLLMRKQVSRDSMLQAIYGALPKETPNSRTLDSMICKLRKKFLSNGISLITLWGSGWALSNDGKKKFRNLIERT